MQKLNGSLLAPSNCSYGAPQSKMALLPNYYRWVHRYFKSYLSGDVLELGCGEGLFLKNYLEGVRSATAVDYDDNLLKRLSQRFCNPKIKTIRADLRGDWSELENHVYDAVIALDLLEHFSDDGVFIEKVKRRLRPGGCALIKVPAQQSLYSNMDRSSGHYRRYDLVDLVSLFERHGYKKIFARYINPIGALTYRFKNSKKTNFSLTFSPNTLRIINLSLVVLRMLDSFPFTKGLSLVCVFASRRFGSFSSFS